MTTDGALPADDPLPGDTARGIVATLAVGTGGWAAIAAAKFTPLLYSGEPWQNDPFDFVNSFVLIALPGLLLAGTLRVCLCRKRSLPPIRRVVDILRLCRVVLVMLAVAVATDWVAVATLRTTYSSATTLAWWAAGLAVATAVVAWRVVRLHHLSTPLRGRFVPTGPDWLSDMSLLVRRHLQGIHPGRVKTLLQRSLVATARFIRRHPAMAAALFALVPSAALSAHQGLAEDYSPLLVIWATFVATCTLFSLTVIVGRYLPILSTQRRPPTRIGIATTVSTSAVAVLTGFRTDLYWLVGTTPEQADLSTVILLTTVWPLAIGLATWAISAIISLAVLHRQQTR